MKAFLIKLALFFISIVLSLIAIEIVVRLIPEKRSPYVDQPLFRAALMPFNSMGYQDFEYPLEKGRDTFRIVTVGDSFTEAGYVSLEDSYPKKLEYYLNSFGNDTGITYQVINMSRGGRSTPREARVIYRNMGELKPDLIILGYCLNDPEDWEDGAGYLKKLREKCYYSSFKKPEGWGCFFYRHSALVRLVTQRIFNAKVKRGHIRYFHKLYRDTYPGWQKTRSTLFALGELSRASNIPVRVLIFPLFAYGLGDHYPFADIHKKLHSALEKAGLSYVDLFPCFKDMDQSRLQYIPYKDSHPSEIAHRIAAEALWQDLVHSGLLPTKIKRGCRPSYPRRAPF